MTGDRALTPMTPSLVCRYHQKVPTELPELEVKATYGLAKPEEFQPITPSQLWTPETYAAFDISKAPMPDFSVLVNSPSLQSLVSVSCFLDSSLSSCVCACVTEVEEER
jgi:hypothetical protein